MTRKRASIIPARQFNYVMGGIEDNDHCFFSAQLRKRVRNTNIFEKSPVHNMDLFC
jgi:hypothetical protein